MTGVEDNALQALRDYSWPGNVRELSNVIEAAFFGRAPMIELANLPSAISGKRQHSAQQAPNVAVGTFAVAERDIIARALEMAGGNKAHAARTLKISRKRLYAKIEKYGLE